MEDPMKNATMHNFREERKIRKKLGKPKGTKNSYTVTDKALIQKQSSMAKINLDKKIAKGNLCPHCGSHELDRMKTMIEVKRQVGNIGAFMLEQTAQFKLDLDEERIRLKEMDESVISSSTWQTAYKNMLQLMKYLKELKFDQNRPIVNYKESDIIVVNRREQKVISEDE